MRNLRKPASIRLFDMASVFVVVEQNPSSSLSQTFLSAEYHICCLFLDAELYKKKNLVFFFHFKLPVFCLIHFIFIIRHSQ